MSTGLGLRKALFSKKKHRGIGATSRRALGASWKLFSYPPARPGDYERREITPRLIYVDSATWTQEYLDHSQTTWSAT